MLAFTFWILEWDFFKINPKYFFFSTIIICFSGIAGIGYFKLFKNLILTVPPVGYALIKDKVYYNGEVLTADSASFSIIDSETNDLAKDRSAVYFQGSLLKGADPKSFLPIKNSNLYFKDKNHVFYKTNIVENADPNTFTPIYFNQDKTSYFRDKNHIFLLGKEIPSVEASSFQLIDNHYFKDQNGVYYDGHKLNRANKDTFSAITNQEGWAKDSSTIYCHGNLIYEGSTKEFILLERNYAKDLNKVYYIKDCRTLMELKDANLSKFKSYLYHPSTQSDATDGVHFWLLGKLLEKKVP